MAKISARGDTAVITLRKTNGGRVIVTERGRLLAQAIQGSGYSLVAAHWVQPGAARTHRASVTQYLLDQRCPGAEVLS